MRPEHSACFEALRTSRSAGIVEYVAKHPDSDQMEIAEYLGLDPAVNGRDRQCVRRDMNALCGVGLLVVSYDGYKNTYRVQPETIQSLITALQALL